MIVVALNENNTIDYQWIKNNYERSFTLWFNFFFFFTSKRQE